MIFSSGVGHSHRCPSTNVRTEVDVFYAEVEVTTGWEPQIKLEDFCSKARKENEFTKNKMF